MKTTITIQPAGYGHNTITVRIDGALYSIKTDNTRLTDRFQDNPDNDEIRQEVIDYVISRQPQY